MKEMIVDEVTDAHGISKHKPLAPITPSPAYASRRPLLKLQERKLSAAMLTSIYALARSR